MDITVTIEGDRLEELQEIVAKIRAEQPASPVTEQSYVEGIVTQHLDSRLTAAYVSVIQAKTLPEMRALLGPRKEIKRVQ